MKWTAKFLCWSVVSLPQPILPGGLFRFNKVDETIYQVGVSG